YQSIILATIAAIYGLSYLLVRYFAKPRARKKVDLLTLMVSEGNHSSKVLLLFSWGLLGLELLKRLYFSGWSVASMLTYSFGPRFNRPWASAAGSLGDEKFVFALVGILLPLAGLILGAEMVNAKKLQPALMSAVGYLMVLVLAIAAGSRTPVVLLVVLPLIFYLKKTRSALKRGLAVLLVASMLTATTSVIYNTRDNGLIYAAQRSAQDAAAVVYHQDDSYYRAINTMHVVDHTYERWALAPFLGASLLNFVPRAIWPEKPALTKEYWGDFKLHYVTITFVAELTALFGIAGGVMIAILVGVSGFLFLLSLYRRIESSYDLLLYVLGSVYIYMVFRSLLNLTQFVYMLLFFFIMLKIDQNLALAKRRKLVRSLYR
ncbi:MAG: hypothetical protein AAFN12_12160, partial [Cyanobacteria bacterium J06560_2]